MPWRIEYDGHSLREGDITLDQAEQMEHLAGEDWRRINPLRSAKHAKAVLTVMYAGATGAQYDDVAEKIGALRASEFVDMFHIDEDDTPSEYRDGFPPQAAGTSTAG